MTVARDDRIRSLHRLFAPVGRHFRRKRGQFFLHILPDFARLRVLDLGGSLHFWEKLDHTAVPRDLTIVNITDDASTEATTSNQFHHRLELYDGNILPYSDASFDVVVCNSVIEHVLPVDRDRFCAELLRVGRFHFVQTPAYVFPIEQHFLLPGLHWLPRDLGRRVNHASPIRLLTGASAGVMDYVFDTINILRLSEFRAHFPTSDLTVERILAVPKSYMLYGPSGGAAR